MADIGELAFGYTPLFIGIDEMNLYSCMYFRRLGGLGYYGSLFPWNGSRAWVATPFGCEIECNRVYWDCQIRERPSWKRATTFLSLKSKAFLCKS